MGELQIYLLIVGAAVIVGVIVYNRVQEARFRRRAEQAFAPDQGDALLEAAHGGRHPHRAAAAARVRRRRLRQHGRQEPHAGPVSRCGSNSTLAPRQRPHRRAGSCTHRAGTPSPTRPSSWPSSRCRPAHCRRSCTISAHSRGASARGPVGRGRVGRVRACRSEFVPPRAPAAAAGRPRWRSDARRRSRRSSRRWRAVAASLSASAEIPESAAVRAACARPRHVLRRSRRRGRSECSGRRQASRSPGRACAALAEAAGFRLGNQGAFVYADARGATRFTPGEPGADGVLHRIAAHAFHPRRHAPAGRAAGGRRRGRLRPDGRHRPQPGHVAGRHAGGRQPCRGDGARPGADPQSAARHLRSHGGGRHPRRRARSRCGCSPEARRRLVERQRPGRRPAARAPRCAPSSSTTATSTTSRTRPRSAMRSSTSCSASCRSWRTATRRCARRTLPPSGWAPRSKASSPRSPTPCPCCR